MAINVWGPCKSVMTQHTEVQKLSVKSKNERAIIHKWKQQIINKKDKEINIKDFKHDVQTKIVGNPAPLSVLIALLHLVREPLRQTSSIANESRALIHPSTSLLDY
mgnify:CR=1 FL=1